MCIGKEKYILTQNYFDAADEMFTLKFMINAYFVFVNITYLNQVCEGLWSVHAWFIEFASLSLSLSVSLCVSLSLSLSVSLCLSLSLSLCPRPEDINNQWHDRCDWLNKFYGFSHFYLLYMTLTVNKMDGHGLSNTAPHERLPKKTNVMCTEETPNSSNKMECFIYKGE